MTCERSNRAKYNSPNRKAPSYAAKNCKLGTTETGNDGEQWIVVKTKKYHVWRKSPKRPPSTLKYAAFAGKCPFDGNWVNSKRFPHAICSNHQPASCFATR